MTQTTAIAPALFRRLPGAVAAALPAWGVRRWTLGAALLSLGLGSSSSVMATEPPVVAIQATRVADLVLLGGGFDAGLREGMVCRIIRGNTLIAEVQVVGLHDHTGAALILSLAPGQSIRAGDLARIKVNPA